VCRGSFLLTVLCAHVLVICLDKCLIELSFVQVEPRKKWFEQRSSFAENCCQDLEGILNTASTTTDKSPAKGKGKGNARSGRAKKPQGQQASSQVSAAGA
jgi:hypothetical protein